MPELDLTRVPPPDRLAAAMEALHSLEPGESLDLTGEGELADLESQLNSARPGEFQWNKDPAGPARVTCLARILDVRPIIERGEEPFDIIMAAVNNLEEGQVFVVIAPFEPVPLEGVLSSQGFDYEASEIGGGDWRVSFTPQT